MVFAGQGDVRRSMALLWRAEAADGVRTGPGPKPGLSVDMILDAAIAVADEVDMAGLSMRAVGERLGRTAMALYTYVPNKGELVDLMYDRTLGELPTEYDLAVGWRAALTTWAENVWSLYLRHPWVLQVSQVRPVLGPNEYVVLEALLRILRETGLKGPVLRHVVGALFHFVRGAAQTVAESRQAPTATGVSDEEWWFARSALLREVAPDFAERFPMVTSLEADGAPRPEDDTKPYLEQEAEQLFDIGLDIILDGIAAAMARA
ncbi:transcriptional regulator, TetR family [Alloactinosynnema sp. L-07]|nr:transcriptional regulator, TetR family [Alloactinosynnema sp. L-07]